jgi:hypothetical protein
VAPTARGPPSDDDRHERIADPATDGSSRHNIAGRSVVMLEVPLEGVPARSVKVEEAG